jgi:hypothetical protein
MRRDSAAPKRIAARVTGKIFAAVLMENPRVSSATATVGAIAANTYASHLFLPAEH